MAPCKRPPNIIFFNKKRENNDKFSILRKLLSKGVYVIEGQPLEESSLEEISKVILRMEKNMTTSLRKKKGNVRAIFEKLKNGQTLVKNNDRLSCKASGNNVFFNYMILKYIHLNFLIFLKQMMTLLI